MKRQLSSLISLCAAVLVVACMDGSRDGSHVTGPKMMAQLDSTDSLPPDTLPQDSLPPDTLPPDTLPPDTLPQDSLPPDSLPPDSLPPDSLPPDSLTTDSLPSDSLPALKARDHRLLVLLQRRK
jgi:hypothetical protein